MYPGFKVGVRLPGTQNKGLKSAFLQGLWGPLQLD